MPPLAPDRWRVLSPHLDATLDVAPEGRDAWLASIAERDPGLAQELRGLLAGQAVADAQHFLDGVALDPRLASAPSLSGQIVGDYRLLELLGEGGSGSVWLAERCDGRFEGRAAVKLLNLALVGRSGQERFRREGTILARLQHPHIAHLADAGVSATGQPYLVLELVDGVPIDRYADQRRLSIDGRLRLFLDVLDGVSHAHANLIVHRDIKPPNVLVRVDGQVKLLDFGIAKLADPSAEWNATRSAEAQALTREVSRALTPEYAAPEQLVGAAVTTATDVYALGVLLYVLLGGRHPAGHAVRTPATLIRAIVEEDPPRVSDVIEDTPLGAEPLGTHAARCSTTPARLRRLLQGDLDTIVAKALKKDAAERYPSVSAFADDLRRYLRHEPISARRDSLAYRTARFVRRHVVGVAISIGVLALVGALATLHTQRLASERDRAQRESAKAVKVSEILMSLLTAADPYAPGPRVDATAARALLDGSVAQVQATLAGEPELQAGMLTMMGRTYRRLGVYDTAESLLEQAMAAAREGFGPEHLRVAQALQDLGVARAEQGHYADAGHQLEAALAMRRRLQAEADPEMGVTLAELGRVYQDQGLGARAEATHREALTVRRTLLGASHRETAVSESDLASVLRLRGDLDGAEALLRHALAVNIATRGPRHPNTATTWHDLALIAEARGDRRAAEALLRDALEIQRASVGPAHPSVAATLNSLARVHAALGRPDDALASQQAALDIVRPALGPDHQTVAIYTLNEAALHLAIGRRATATDLLREGLRVRALAPQVVAARRRTVAADDWTLDAARHALHASLSHP